MGMDLDLIIKLYVKIKNSKNKNIEAFLKEFPIYYERCYSRHCIFEEKYLKWNEKSGRYEKLEEGGRVVNAIEYFNKENSDEDEEWTEETIENEIKHTHYIVLFKNSYSAYKETFLKGQIWLSPKSLCKIEEHIKEVEPDTGVEIKIKAVAEIDA